MAGFAEGVAADPRIGQLLGEYRIKELLGRGGMGVVYMAEHERLGRNVALKLLAPALAQNEVGRERFVRESRRAAAIDHPNIIPLFEAGEVDGHLFITMRYVAGVNLRELLESEGSPLAPERALRIVAQVGAALDAAHAVGLVHRDVKPANVMVDRQAGADGEHCYLTDFGLTKDISSSTGFTDTGQFVGTINYVAPEQVEGRSLDARTDLYALGCMLYECLTGQVPFPRDSDLAVMFAHVSEPPPRPSAVRPELGSAMDTVIARALAKSQEDRHATCAELVAEARGALAGEEPPPRPVAAAPAPAPPTEQAPEPPHVPVTEASAAAAGRAGSGAPPVPPAWRAGGAYVPQQPPPEDDGPNYMVAAAIVAIAVLLTAGGIVAALLLTGGDDGGGGTRATEDDSAEARRLIRETAQLNRDVIRLEAAVARQGQVGRRTIARIERERDDARRLQVAVQRDLGELRRVRRSLLASTRLVQRATKQLETVATSGSTSGLDEVTLTITQSVTQVNEAAEAYPQETAESAPPLPGGTEVDMGSLPAVSLNVPDDANVRITGGEGEDVGAITGVGDVNGDDRDDLVATMSDSEGESTSYVVFGQPEATDVQLGQLGDDGFELIGADAGYGTAPGGDIDGDGKDEVVIFDPTEDVDGGDGWTVVFGRSSGDVDVTSPGPDTAVLTLDTRANDYYIEGVPAGPSAMGIGDVDGDGGEDFAFATPSYDNGAGGVRVVTQLERGDEVDLDALGDAGFRIEGLPRSTAFGGSLAKVGDVNGDDIDDIAVGAPLQRNNRGSAYVVFGSREPADVDASALGDRGLRLVGGAGTSAGASIVGLGDLNEDGLSDFLVGAPTASPSARRGAGVAYVVFGRDEAGEIDLTGLGAGGYRIDGPAPARTDPAELTPGIAVDAAAAGDVNGDGLGDAVIGVTYLEQPVPLAYIVYGKGSTDHVDLADPGGQAVALEGPSEVFLWIGAGADFNGDKRAEVPVGYGLSDGTPAEGYLFEAPR